MKIVEIINRYLKLFSYKIKQQIQEEKESKEEQLSHNEILRILTSEKLLNDIAKIESYNIVNSKHLIILISQKHGSKYICQEIQDDIFEINKRLIENNICKTFANEGVTFKEMDDENSLVFFNKYDTTQHEKYHFTTAWRLEKVFADKIFSSGLEDLVVKNEADIAMDNYSINKSNSKTVNSFQEKTLNARNEVFIKHATIIMNNTRKNVIALKIGALHMENYPSYFNDLPKHISDEKCLTMQEICKANNVSYIHIIPKSLHY